jgi:hypothetical protein
MHCCMFCNRVGNFTVSEYLVTALVTAAVTARLVLAEITPHLVSEICKALGEFIAAGKR